MDSTAASFLMASGVATVCHYALYYAVRPMMWHGIVDRMLWLSVSLGLAVAWTGLFWPALSVGRIGLGLLDVAIEDRELLGSWTFTQLLEVFMGSFPVFALYFWITGMTSSCTSRGFLARKMIPTSVICALLASTRWNSGAASIPPSSVIAVSAWFLRYMWIDTMIDAHQFFAALPGRAAAEASRVLFMIAGPSWILVVMYEFVTVYVTPERLGIVWISIPAALALWVLIVEVNPTRALTSLDCSDYGYRHLVNRMRISSSVEQSNRPAVKED